MKPKGGVRPGAGRKPRVDEDRSRRLSEKAIIDKYGSLDKGLIALLSSGEPALIKFVFEHAFGKPKENIDVSSLGEKIDNVYMFEIPKNGRELAEAAISHTNGNGNHS